MEIIKIDDFKLAKKFLHDLNDLIESYVVMRPYQVVELLLGSTHYEFTIDIWVMGVIMAKLFTLHLLFSGSNIFSIIGSRNKETWLQGLVVATFMNYRFLDLSL